METRAATHVKNEQCVVTAEPEAARELVCGVREASLKQELLSRHQEEREGQHAGRWGEQRTKQRAQQEPWNGKGLGGIKRVKRVRRARWSFLGNLHGAGRPDQWEREALSPPRSQALCGPALAGPPIYHSKEPCHAPPWGSHPVGEVITTQPSNQSPSPCSRPTA